jgi:glucokinase
MTRPEHSIPPYFLGIDVGGTNIKVGIVSSTGVVMAKSSIPTEVSLGFERGLTNIKQAVMEVIEKSQFTLADIHSVGIATPGPLDIPEGFILHPANLPTWHNTPIRERLRAMFGKSTVLQNDANAAAYGEYWAGAGQGCPLLMMWTMGTGIGSGIVIEGKILSGIHSHGGECGHINIEMDNGRLCTSGQYGTLEAYCGGWAITARCKELLAAGRPSMLHEQISQGKSLNPYMIMMACEDGDQLAREIIHETARIMGVGTTTVMHSIDPAMVLIGGAVTFGRNDTATGRLFLQTVREEVKKRAFPILAQRTVIDWAMLGGDAGFIGAAGCAKQAFAG